MEIKVMVIDHYEKVYHLWSNTTGMGIRSLDDSKNGIYKFLLRNPTSNFVAIINSEIVGVILCGHDGRRGYIYHAAVKINYRGQGIGKALLKAVYYALEQEGITKSGLVVFKTNEIGNSFWKSQEWEERTDLNYYSNAINNNI
ncbi:GNAT family N-acetyltransferase [Clostridium tagluense]|uniref:GNAT family N-acetyltransferase n=1 Tax=Clostridium tagluense TaxID=360422 RepID=UPI001C6F0B16|nr:GNAT family N-acetyltransferase [Clostridium tagluense]MBW9156082.1 GNAT family N-acetyltransferase [Clostridium tagluense]WLC65677.1 GNAT family N-acetyltransferase [Clostridium tagluense]